MSSEAVRLTLVRLAGVRSRATCTAIGPVLSVQLAHRTRLHRLAQMALEVEVRGMLLDLMLSLMVVVHLGVVLVVLLRGRLRMVEVLGMMMRMLLVLIQLVQRRHSRRLLLGLLM